jgi:hypothetical protein
MRNMSSLRSAASLAGVHLLLSLAAIIVLILKRGDHAVATQDAWVHGIIVAGTAVLLLSFAIRALGGRAAAYRRLRVSSAVLTVALVVIAVIPGAFPVWMRALEGASAICLAAAVAIINSGGVRRRFLG